MVEHSENSQDKCQWKTKLSPIDSILPRICTHGCYIRIRRRTAPGKLPEKIPVIHFTYLIIPEEIPLFSFLVFFILAFLRTGKFSGLGIRIPYSFMDRWNPFKSSRKHPHIPILLTFEIGNKCFNRFRIILIDIRILVRANEDKCISGISDQYQNHGSKSNGS